jgi:mannitol-specific phosphotransferase system IIBC component
MPGGFFYLLKLEIMEMTNDNTTIIGTVSGTILSVVAMFDAGDIIKTVIMATIGAVVSFLVSRGLKWLWGRWRRWYDNS